MDNIFQKDRAYKILIEGSIQYSIYDDDKTATLTYCLKEIDKLFILRCIKLRSTEYDINVIGQNSFEYIPIRLVEFAPDSKIQIIEEAAFSVSLIESITIPSEVTTIDKNSFYECGQLQKVEFAPDSKLQIIEKGAFNGSSIESFTIPPKVTSIEEGWCNYALKLTKIDVDPSNPIYRCLNEQMIVKKESIESTNFDCLFFCIKNKKNDHNSKVHQRNLFRSIFRIIN